MSERSVHLPGATALALLQQRAQVGLDTWIEEWAVGQPPSTALSVDTTIDFDEWQGHTFLELRDSNGGLWISASAADRARLTQSIFGPDPRVAPCDVIEEITGMAALALAEELRAALFGEASLPLARPVAHPPNEVFAFGSGAVQMVCNPLGLRAVVDAGVWCVLSQYHLV